jgi:subtilisin family serine protease
VIAVGAIISQGERPIWSNYGPELDLVAPGVNVLSTFYTGIDYFPVDRDTFIPCAEFWNDQPGYGPCSGTIWMVPI